jgi:hypothetical protein
MFEEMPNRRITERRKSLKDALIAAISLFVGTAQALRKGRLDWETLGWAAVFILSILGYWKGKHEDPWNPPIERSEPPPANELKLQGKN